MSESYKVLFADVEKRPLLRKNTNVVTMPTRDVLLRHFRKHSYTRKGTRLHTLISYVHTLDMAYGVCACMCACVCV